jgi:hypothetical protein
MRITAGRYGNHPGLIRGKHQRMTYVFEGVNNTHGIPVKLGTLDSVPAAERICPIMMDSFDACVLSHNPETNFILPRADLCVATLPCGHRFGIMTILIHFALTDLRCPMCRQGVSQKLDIGCLPLHLRSGIRKRRVDAHREELEQQSLQDHADIQQMLESDPRAFEEDDFGNLVVLPAINMSIYYFERSDDNSTQIGSLEFTMVHRSVSEYEISETDIGRVSQALRSSGAETMRITVHTRSMVRSMLRLADTTILRIADLFPSNNSSRVVEIQTVATEGNRGDTFTIQRSNSMSLVISGIRWRSSAVV